jgi:hypothetical protein
MKFVRYGNDFARQIDMTRAGMPTRQRRQDVARAASSVFRISVSHIDKPLIRRPLTGKTRANSMRGHHSRNLALGQEAVLAVHIRT